MMSSWPVFGANSLRDGIVEAQLAAEKVLDDIAPDIFRLANYGRHAAFVQELARVGEAADMEAAHHRGQPLGDHLEGEVAATRILIRLYGRPTRSAARRRPRAPFFNRGDRLGADYAVADFVPNHGFEANIALDRMRLLNASLSAVITGQGVVGLDAIAEVLDEAVFVVT